jgi:hypothetical protein
MREWSVDDATNAPYARVDRSAPRRRDHIHVRAAPVQGRDQRFGEDRVADPRRRDDERAR